MHTISALARNAPLPRRTLQYWHDRGVITPASRTPVVYGDDELILARLLAPFAHTTASVGTISMLSELFKMVLSGDSSVPADVAKAFAHAKANKEGFFVIALELEQGKEGTVWPWTRGAINETALANAVIALTEWRPNLPVTIINLGYALNPAMTVGLVYE